MTFNAFFQVIKEQTEELDATKLSQILVNACKVYFDTDDIAILRTRTSAPEPYYNSVNRIVIGFNYNQDDYSLFINIFFSKFPLKEIRGLSEEEHSNMLQHAAQMPKTPLTKNLLDKPNIQIVFDIELLKNEDAKSLVRKRFHGNLNTLMQTVKDAIEKSEKTFQDNAQL